MGLKLWLPLDGSLRNLGVSNIEVTNNGATVSDDGKIGKCYHFGTTNSYITLPKEAMNSFTTECSVAFWLRIKTWNTGWATYFQAGLGSTAWTNYIFGFLRNSSGSTVCFTIGNGSSASNNSYLTSALELNKWYHVVLTYETGKCNIYLNGILDKEYSTSLVPAFSSITKITLGKCNDGTSYQTDCDINDFRLYDHCLSAAEVHDIAQGLVLHYKLNQANPNLIPTNIFDNAPWKGAIAAHEMYENRLAYRITNYSLYNNTNKGANDLFSGNITYAENTQYTLSVTWRDDYRTDNKTSALYLRFNYTDGSTATNMISPANSLHEWTHQSITSTPGKTISKITTTYGNGGQLYITDLKLEIGTIDSGMLYTNNQIIDSSGYGHNGWTIDTEITSTTPRYKSAIVCNGANPASNTLTGAEYFFGNLPMPASSAITVAWWGKNDNYSRGGIFETTASTFTATTGMVPSDYNTTAIANWDTTFRVYNGSSSVNIYSSFVKDGNWHHHAIVFDGANVYYYCDGIVETSGTLTGTIPAFNGIRVGLGRAGGVYRQIKQSISDLRIYCTPLLDTDIKSLYNIGMRIDNLGNVHTFELIESNAEHITKSGQLITKGLEEINENKARLTNCDGWQSSEFIEI